MTKGYKSTEFWFSVAAMLVGVVMASGVVPDESGFAKILGLVASTLAALGYTASRTLVKGAASKTEALKSLDPSKG